MKDHNTVVTFNNPQVAALPRHLKQYVVEQDYGRYTPVDQAVWRYVMRQNYHHLKDIAYYPYIPGLKAAGLSIEKIPDLQEMNDALAKIGWGAVTVDGFIPPAAFMEFQAYRVLVIAADIRNLEHIEYTPAPDIIHESAGHAPIIADVAYHNYLSYFGSIGAKATYSAQDVELYEAIRALSVIKESPAATAQEIQAAEDRVAFCQENMKEPSEMALLSRLHWWTVEYGLIGTLAEPKIYGAGLLSSIGESASCMRAEVTKLPYTIDAVNYPYDITKPQPQLFVTPTFKNLKEVLEQFADTMAFRVGGAYGLKKAIASNTTCTVVYSSGLQVCGTFTTLKTFGNDEPVLIVTNGPTALSYHNHVLPGHDQTAHPNGFSSPVGKLKSIETPLEFRLIEIDKFLVLHFESGIMVMGMVTGVLRIDGRNLLISFTDCTVMDRRGEILFDPSWGVYDLAVGEHITSVFCGAADKDAFTETAYVPATRSKRPKVNNANLELQGLYQKVRDCRQQRVVYSVLIEVWENLQQYHPGDWLCALEILEILANEDIKQGIALEINTFLKIKSENEPALKKLIKAGLKLIDELKQAK